jgi:hypothetical protein
MKIYERANKFFGNSGQWAERGKMVVHLREWQRAIILRGWR